ncbi:MAG: 2-amino-4-hydroxy-6-hydroxymethyldihydropteridine diphosphokinase [bacterium]|nr:2-amino-4-hydroxy-6-hydroxymethyldihydropteridine diphosphokinase [bacterium]
MPQNAYIALGSNLGDRESYIRGAIEAVGGLEGTDVVAQSSVIETDPVGPDGQGPYLNAVIHIQTTLAPRELLDELLRIEQDFGRERAEQQRWGPRTLDLDVLVYEDMIIEEQGLNVPHPRLHDRLFVLVPLAEIAPDLNIPMHEKTPRAMLRALVNH